MAAKKARPKKAPKKTPRARAASVKHILGSDSNLSERYISDYKRLRDAVDTLKGLGYRIVLTQGVYDMLHEGHAKYLEKARSYGDLLVVGVDSDELTRKRKGPNRPVVPEKERLHMLAHLRSVSILTLRHVRHEPGMLIKTVRPDVLVTSASTKDFTGKDAQVYKAWCGEIVVLPAQAATSTTARVRLLTIDGADQLARDIVSEIPTLVDNALKRFRS